MHWKGIFTYIFVHRYKRSRNSYSKLHKVFALYKSAYGLRPVDKFSCTAYLIIYGCVVGNKKCKIFRKNLCRYLHG